MSEDKDPFDDLPASLVDDVLKQTSGIGEELLKVFQEHRERRQEMREQLKDRDYLIKESSLGYPPHPTTCATDGSYAIERLLSVDLAVAAAVAVEGLSPPSEKRHWEAPHHKTLVFAEPHHDETVSILRAAMLGEELVLGCKAPHDLVLLDCTLTLPIIYLNQGISAAGKQKHLGVAKHLLDNATNYLRAYRNILESNRPDHQIGGLPKYSTRREIGQCLGWPTTHDDRGLLTLVLKAGELTRPVPLEQPPPGDSWHIGTQPISTFAEEAASLAKEVETLLGNVHVLYYKPHDWLPTLRVEVASDVAKNSHRLAVVIQGLKHQCATSGMLEPFPLYLADRTVKALTRSLPAFRQIITQDISNKYSGDIAEVFFAMHGYRTDGGR